MLTRFCLFPPDFLYSSSPCQFHCKLAVAIATPDTHFDELLLVSPVPQAPGSLPLIITEVPFDLDFGETNPRFCEAAEFVIFR